MEQSKTIEGYPLSPQQRRLWQLQADSRSLVSQCGVLIHGPLEFDRLRECVSQVIRSHEILHTAFQRLPAMALSLQVIVEPNTPPVRVLDYSDLTGFDASLSLLCAEERARSFALEQGDVLHVVLARAGADRHLLVLTLPA